MKLYCDIKNHVTLKVTVMLKVTLSKVLRSPTRIFQLVGPCEILSHGQKHEEVLNFQSITLSTMFKTWKKQRRRWQWQFHPLWWMSCWRRVITPIAKFVPAQAYVNLFSTVNFCYISASSILWHRIETILVRLKFGATTISVAILRSFCNQSVDFQNILIF